jgi:hypothetical protein
LKRVGTHQQQFPESLLVPEESMLELCMEALVGAQEMVLVCEGRVRNRFVLEIEVKF